jgi:hypothetical protein
MQPAQPQQPPGDGPVPKRQRSPPQGFRPTKYVVLAYKTMDGFGERLERADPERFSFYKTKWGKFEDSGMDHIVVGGFSPTNVCMRSHILFLADFHSNDAILSQVPHTPHRNTATPPPRFSARAPGR